MTKYLVLLVLCLSGCSKPYTYFCQTPVGNIKGEGYIKEGTVEFKAEDGTLQGTRAKVPFADCVGVEVK